MNESAVNCYCAIPQQIVCVQGLTGCRYHCLTCLSLRSQYSHSDNNPLTFHSVLAAHDWVLTIRRFMHELEMEIGSSEVLSLGQLTIHSLLAA